MGPLGGDLSHEGGALMNGMSALIKGTPESSPAFLHGRTQREDGYVRTAKGILTRHRICLPASGTVRNQFLLATSHPVCGILP